MDARASNSELVNELKQWCRGEGLDETHAIMVLVPEGFEIAQVEATMETIKALGRVCVRGQSFNQKLDLVTVLCECKEEVDSSKVPPEVLRDGETEAWNLVMVSGVEQVFKEPMGSPEEGVGNAALGGSPESIIRAVGELITKIEKPYGENSSYRRLRLFSGTLPTWGRGIRALVGTCAPYGRGERLLCQGEKKTHHGES